MSKSTFTQSIADEICERLSAGEPLAVMCREGHMPAKRTVSDWRRANKEFDTAFLAARDEGYDAIAQQCLDIADDGRRDYEVGEDGKAVVDHDHIQRSKLRVDTRLKLLAKWDPRRYGERLDLNHGGTVRTISRVELVALGSDATDGEATEG